MKDKKECKIMQEFLLPNYVDDLVDDEIKNYIENHLNECNECKMVFRNMKEKQVKEKDNINKNSINYMKKVNKKQKTLKLIILFILIIVLVLFGMITYKKMSIISELYKSAQIYENIDNYHITLSSCEDGNFYKSETFVKGNKIKIEAVNVIDGKVEKTTTYGILEKREDGIAKYATKDYIEKDDEKILITDGNLSMPEIKYDSLKTDSFLELFKSALKANIVKTVVKGVNCYYISNFKTNNYTEPQNDMYISEETGLEIVSNDVEKGFQECFYEFNTITEDSFKEPNKEEYKQMTLEEYAESIK